MRKKILAGVCTVFLLMGLLLPAASSGPLRLFSNDTEMTGIPKLIQQGGTVYIPAEVLSSMGATHIYSADSKPVTETLAVIHGYKILAFDMTNGICVTDDNRYVAMRAFYQDGTYYVPAQFVAKELGYYYAELSNDVIRIYDSSAGKSNAQIEEQTKPVVPTDPPVVPQPPDEIAAPDATRIYFGLVGLPVEGEGMLELLERKGRSATIYLTAAELEEQPQMVRSLLAQGYAIGLSLLEVDPSAEGAEYLAQCQEANAVFQKITKTRCVQALLPDSLAQDALDLFASEGYRTMLASIRLENGEYKSFARAFTALAGEIKNASGTPAVFFDCSNLGSKVLQRFFEQGQDYAVTQLNEYRMPK